MTTSRLRSTHTEAELAVSASAFEEIRAHLVEAGYAAAGDDHLSMHGIRLVCDNAGPWSDAPVVHNHGPEDGPGIACRETLIGDCIRFGGAAPTAAVSIAARLARVAKGEMGAEEEREVLECALALKGLVGTRTPDSRRERIASIVWEAGWDDSEPGEAPPRWSDVSEGGEWSDTYGRDARRCLLAADYILDVIERDATAAVSHSQPQGDGMMERLRALGSPLYKGSPVAPAAPAERENA